MLRRLAEAQGSNIFSVEKMCAPKNIYSQKILRCVGIERLELSQHYCHMLLKHTCIPISPYPQEVGQFFKLDAQKTRSFKKEKVKKAYLKQYKTKLKKSLR